MALHWFQFFLRAAVVVWAGNRLAKSASIIADRTGIGAAWAGALMLPLVTSLPELVTSIRSALVTAPDLAKGHSFGSNLDNLALVDMAKGCGRFINLGHILTVSLSIISLCLTALALLAAPLFPFVGWPGSGIPLIGLLYLPGCWLIFKYERKNVAVSTSPPETVTTLSAVRLGLLDLAPANVFGANLMNIFILFWADLFYLPAAIFTVVSQTRL